MKRRVLIVDDETMLVGLIGDYLEKRGYDILAAYDGKTALELWEGQTPDLVVLDIMLPDIDGWEICRRIRERASTPIIMLSASSTDHDKLKGLGLGADHYMTKPFSLRELAARIEAVLRRYELDNTKGSVKEMYDEPREGRDPGSPPLIRNYAAPPPPPPPQPPRTQGKGRLFAGMAALSVVIALAVLFLVPLALGANPIDVLQGRGKTSTVTQTQIVSPETGVTATEAVAAKIMPSVVNIEVTVSAGFGQTGQGIASGFFFRDGGYILTNNHVVQGASAITVTTADGKDLKAKVVGTDPDTDLAVIQVSGATAPVAELGNSAGLQVGQEVVAVGSPAGLEQTVTQGIISALHRNLPDFHPTNASNTTPLLDVIQTDAAINPGNSGGPLADMNGKVVGVNSAIYSESGGSEGLGFSIPIDTAKAIADQLVSSGSVSHAFLGISGQTVTSALARANNLSVDYGALVADVFSGSAASQAGLQRGDIIIALDGNKMATMDQLMLYVRGKSVGSKITITYMRGSEKHDAEATLQAKSGTS